MLITRVCPVTGAEKQMDLPVTEHQITRWQDGAYIQDAMPHLTPDQREFLITGMTPDVWDQIFPEED